MKIAIKTPLFLVLIFSVLLANAQQAKKPINFVLGEYPAQPQSPEYFTRSGYLPTSQFRSNFTYYLYFGKKDATTPGWNRVVKLFDIEGESYSVTKAVPGEKPFKKVIIRRSSNDQKTTALFEIPSALGNPVADRSSVYILPDYSGNMEDLINTYTINRGTDNVFVNDAATTTNIERVDMILDSPMSVASLNKQTSGFLLMDRGGNDNFKVAAIIGFNDVTDEVTQLTAAATVSKSYWGQTGVNIISVVLQGQPEELYPSQTISLQSLSGVFVPLSIFNNLPDGATLYGISVFANDVNLSPEDLLDIDKYPTNTPEAIGSQDNGLDLMAGGGFFTKAILVKGKIWKDESLDAIINNGENGIDAGIWVNLVDPDDKVVSSVKVADDGSYTLFVPDNGIVSGNYKVILTTKEYYEGNVLTASERPDGYGFTGVNVGGTPNTSNKSGIIDIGEIDGNGDITDVNFGILDEAQLPVTFGSIQAYIKNNELFVLWSTLSEVGNSRFEIEASYDGKNFFKIGEVASQAEGGNSSSELQYSFQKKISASLLFIPVLAAVVLMLFAFNRKNKLWALSLLFAMVSLFGFYSCKKSDQAFTKDADKLFIRIKQIDLDNQYEYSKTVQVIKY